MLKEVFLFARPEETPAIERALLSVLGHLYTAMPALGRGSKGGIEYGRGAGSAVARLFSRMDTGFFCKAFPRPATNRVTAHRSECFHRGEPGMGTCARQSRTRSFSPARYVGHEAKGNGEVVRTVVGTAEQELKQPPRGGHAVSASRRGGPWEGSRKGEPKARWVHAPQMPSCMLRSCWITQAVIQH